MRIHYHNLDIRQATAADAKTLCGWWNDPAVMSFSRYPRGRNLTPSRVTKQIERESNPRHRRLILELNKVPIGEMYYKFRSDYVVEIGIKICDLSLRDQGYGTLLVSMLIGYLFTQTGAERVLAVTELKNLRAQHQLQKLGFQQLNTHPSPCKNQLGESQTYLTYELRETRFINYAK